MYVTLTYFLKCIIREMNKKLYDSNDDLRSALASEAVAAKRRVTLFSSIDIFPYTLWLSQVEAHSQLFS